MCLSVQAPAEEASTCVWDAWSWSAAEAYKPKGIHAGTVRIPAGCGVICHRSLSQGRSRGQAQ